MFVLYVMLMYSAPCMRPTGDNKNLNNIMCFDLYLFVQSIEFNLIHGLKLFIAWAESQGGCNWGRSNPSTGICYGYQNMGSYATSLLLWQPHTLPNVHTLCVFKPEWAVGTYVTPLKYTSA